MNSELQLFARQTIKDGLSKCTDGQQLVFKRMYANGNLETPINEVVDNISEGQLDWAMQQVLNTLKKQQAGELPQRKSEDEDE